MRIEFDVKGALDRLDTMMQRIDHAKRVDLGHELADWQVSDMHRHRPLVMRSRARGMASTVIRPHSKYEVEHSARYQRRMALRVARGTRRSMQVFRTWEGKTSLRPILRASLTAELIERLAKMVQEKLKW